MSANTSSKSNLSAEHKTDYAGTDELWLNEKFLKNYNADLVLKLSKFSDKKSDVFEFGAGIGTLAQLWRSMKKIEPECFELYSNLRKVLVERKFVCYENIEQINKTYDLIYTSNVLEHIDDDVGALKKLRSKIKLNGYIAIYVPAFSCLYTGFDAALGHCRRYEKKELIKKVIEADFKIKECSFVDSIGFFAWLIIKLSGHHRDNKLLAGNSLEIYDKYIYPVSKLLDNLGLKFLFGKNLLIIAQKVS